MRSSRESPHRSVLIHVRGFGECSGQCSGCVILSVMVKVMLLAVPKASEPHHRGTYLGLGGMSLYPCRGQILGNCSRVCPSPAFLLFWSLPCWNHLLSRGSHCCDLYSLPVSPSPPIHQLYSVCICQEWIDKMQCCALSVPELWCFLLRRKGSLSSILKSKWTKTQATKLGVWANLASEFETPLE